MQGPGSQCWRGLLPRGMSNIICCIFRFSHGQDFICLVSSSMSVDAAKPFNVSAIHLYLRNQLYLSFHVCCFFPVCCEWTIQYLQGLLSGTHRTLRSCSCLAKDTGLTHPCGVVQVTFVVVQKRHNTRLFPTNSQQADRSGNCLPGVVNLLTPIISPLVTIATHCFLSFRIKASFVGSIRS